MFATLSLATVCLLCVCVCVFPIVHTDRFHFPFNVFNLPLHYNFGFAFYFSFCMSLCSVCNPIQFVGLRNSSRLFFDDFPSTKSPLAFLINFWDVFDSSKYIFVFSFDVKWTVTQATQFQSFYERLNVSTSQFFSVHSAAMGKNTIYPWLNIIE